MVKVYPVNCAIYIDKQLHLIFYRNRYVFLIIVTLYTAADGDGPTIVLQNNISIYSYPTTLLIPELEERVDLECYHLPS